MGVFKETFLFICQTTEGEIFIATKEDVDSLIDNTSPDEDLNFETIGKIPLSKFRIDGEPSIIEFYKPDIEQNIAKEAFLLAIKFKTDYKL